MHRPPNSTRRRFLGLAGGAAVLGAIPAVTVRPAEATPAMLASAIRNVTGGAAVKTGKVKLDVPPLVENGNTVPLTVGVDHPMAPEDHVTSIHVFNEKIRSRTLPTSIWARIPAVRRSRPAFALPTARKSLRSQSSRTVRSGRPASMSW